MAKLENYRTRAVAPDTGQAPEALRDLGKRLLGRSFATSDGYAVTIECDVRARGLAEAAAEALKAISAAAELTRCPVEPDSITATRYA
jgi:hypothetical protein